MCQNINPTLIIPGYATEYSQYYTEAFIVIKKKKYEIWIYTFIGPSDKLIKKYYNIIHFRINICICIVYYSSYQNYSLTDNKLIMRTEDNNR